MTVEAKGRWQVSIGLVGGMALVMTAVALLHQANDADAAPEDVRELLECAEGSHHVVGSGPLYRADFRTESTPNEIARQYGAEHSLDERTNDIALDKIHESSDRVDIAFRIPDGRTIAVASAVNSNGWKLDRSVECAKW